MKYSFCSDLKGIHLLFTHERLLHCFLGHLCSYIGDYEGSLSVFTLEMLKCKIILYLHIV